MTSSPMLNPFEIVRCLKEAELRAKATDDEKVVRITGCPTIVKRGRLEIQARKAVRAVMQSFEKAQAR